MQRGVPVSWVRVDQKAEDMGQYHNLIAELYQEDQPVFINLIQTSLKILTEIETCLMPDLQSQTTFLRTLLTLGLNLAITLRHLATGESYI